MRTWTSSAVVVLIAGTLLSGLTTPARAQLGRPGEVYTPGVVPLFERTLQPWTARLSPDGTKALYYRVLEGGGVENAPAPGGRPGVFAARTPFYELVLRDLATGKDTPLPTGPISRTYMGVSTRFDSFDPAGKTLALIRFLPVGEPADGAAPMGRQRPRMVLFLYDLATGKTRETGIEGQFFAKFDRTGQWLLVTGERSIAKVALKDLPAQAGAPAPALKPLAIEAFLQSVCPAADVIAACTFRRPAGGGAAPAEGRPVRPVPGLSLYDLAADKVIAELPVHERNTKLDDYEAQWTADGRYLCYYDLEVAADGTESPVMRVWDRTAGKQAAAVRDAVAVGPGPTPTSVVVTRRQGVHSDIALHDVAAGKTTVLVEAPANLLHARGKKMLYARRSPEGVMTTYVADVK